MNKAPLGKTPQQIKVGDKVIVDLKHFRNVRGTVTKVTKRKLK